ncbi:MAG: flagellar biosynthesis protein FlgN [Spirochaetota bacterium]
MAAVYEGEIQKRVALLRRLRELLKEQRGKFEKYLNVLDHEKKDIESGDVERLVAHVEIEEAIVSEIYTFQKVIDPLEELYQAELSPGVQDIHGLRDSLKEMKSEVLKRNAENRTLLKSRMDIVRGEVLALRKPFAARPVYGNGEGGNLVDISG